MGNLAGKTLWVMRHGRPNVPPNPLLMTKTEFNHYLHQYDVAGLSPTEARRLTAMYEEFPRPDLVIASDLPRAKQTAELFGGDAPLIVDSLFREIPVKVPESSTWFLDRRWPGEFWWSYLRSSWFFDIPPEGRKRSTERSRKAVEKIVEWQQQAEQLAIVSHSGFLLVTIHLMIQMNLIQGRWLPHIAFGQPTRYQWR